LSDIDYIGHLRFESEKGRPVATVSASASDLILLLWRRIGPGDVRIEGDRSAVEKLLGWLDLT
jgi:hypothetical protein